MSQWKKFNEKNWDEPGAVFCGKCGAKNRSDSGWFRRESVAKRQDIELQAKALTTELNMKVDFDVSSFQKHEYRCNWCWREENPYRCSVCKEPGHTKRLCKQKVNQS